MNFKEANEILDFFKPWPLKKNKVTKIIEFGVPYQPPENFRPRYRAAEFLINQHGKIYDYKIYSGIQVKVWLQFQYTIEGELVNVKLFDSKKEKWEFIIDQKVSEEITTEIVDGSKIESSFYLNGKLKTQKIINSTGHIVSDKEYKNGIATLIRIYSPKNKILSDYRFDSKGNPTTKRDYEYDNKENLVRYKYTGKKGVVTTDLKMTYDECNNLIESVDIPKEIYSVLYNVDLDKWAEQGDENESYRHKYTYNDCQLLVEHQIYLAGQFGIGHEYEYEFRKQ
jgi:hypothetical protein